MQGRDAALPERALQRQVEIRRIDADEHIGRVVDEMRTDASAQAQQARQVHQHLGESHHGEFFGVRQRAASGGAHARSGDALELSLRAAGTNRVDKRRAQMVTGQFPGHHGDSQG